MRGLLVLVGVVLMTFWMVAAQQPPTDEVVAKIDAAVRGVAGVVQVFSVEVLTEDAALLVMYETRETDEIGYMAEIMDIYRAVARVMAADSLDFGTLIVVPNVDMGGDTEAIEQVSINGDDALALYRGEITRGDFLTRLIRAPGDHGEGRQTQGEV
ncbi:MAG: hypothetical protein HC828_20805 [Blastochloris sp.]|nr:hypothetical protein [Blastochloris sp.]